LAGWAAALLMQSQAQTACLFVEIRFAGKCVNAGTNLTTPPSLLLRMQDIAPKGRGHHAETAVPTPRSRATGLLAAKGYLTSLRWVINNGGL